MSKTVNFITDLRVIVIIISTVIILLARMFGYADLPKLVAANENGIKVVAEAVEVNEDKVQQLAYTVEKYVAVQEVREEGRDKREKLLVQMLRELKNGD